jgi:hypothetical protein
MAIDLVGITYITKIHYFGRKFRGTDILQLLKRKRALERQLAMGNTDEFLHMVQQIAQEQQKEAQPTPVVVPPARPALNLNTANESWQNDNGEEASMRSGDQESWHADQTIVEESMNREAIEVEEGPMTDEALMEIMRLQALNIDSTTVEGELHQANYIPRPPSPISNSSAGGRSL